jgi:hypothetical protein
MNGKSNGNLRFAPVAIILCNPFIQIDVLPNTYIIIKLNIMKIQLFALLLLPACLSAQSSTVTRSLESFDKIGISGGFDVVYLKQGNEESVQLDLKGIDADNIETSIKNGVLKIQTKKGSYNNYSAKITVTYKSLKSVANSGSTDVEALTVIKAPEFEYASSGSGDFKGELDVNDLDIAISGSSDMKLSGRAEEQEIAISGSGDVDASALSGNTAEVAISGSGDVKLGVKGKVKTAVSGSGRVSNK